MDFPQTRKRDCPVHLCGTTLRAVVLATVHAPCNLFSLLSALQCRLYELANGKRITVRGASKLLANTMYSYKGMGLSMVSPVPLQHVGHVGRTWRACLYSVS